MSKPAAPEKFIVFGAPDIQAAEIAEVVDSLEVGWLGTGPKVHRFEHDFAAYKGVDANCVAALNSCTAALHVAMLAAGLQSGDEVITTAMTFCATANAVIHAGAIPVPVDIDRHTLNMDPQQLEQHITPRTRAIVPVHFAGRPCDMDAIMAIARRHNLQVIEDCAHAIETTYHGQQAGSFGDFGCFSFYATKNVATGEGGMVIGKSADSIDRIKVLALHGMSRDAWHRFGDAGYKHYQVVEAGFKYNMMDLQAAIGIHQLARVEQSWSRRQEIWSRYQQAFCDLPIGIPAEPEPNTRHAYHLYTILVEPQRCGLERDAFMAEMTRARIGIGVHYQSLAQHQYYLDRFGWKAADYPVANAVGLATVSLPISPKLSDLEIDYIIATVRGLLAS